MPYSSTTSKGFGALQRLHLSRLAKFTLPQAEQVQFPSTPACGGPLLCGAAVAIAAGAIPIAGCFGVLHRLQRSRCGKFTLPQASHSQLPLMPAIGFCPAGWTYGLGVAQRLQVSRNWKFTLPHASQDQFPSKPATGGPRFDGCGDSKLGFGKAQPVKKRMFFSCVCETCKHVFSHQKTGNPTQLNQH